MIARQYPDFPLVGVGAVVFNDENKILLVQRNQEPNQGLWALPGGLVEVGEEIKTAVKREVKEECDLDIEVGEVLSVVDLILKDQDKIVKYHYILIDYYAKYIKGKITPQSDVQDAKWFSRQEITQLNIPEVTRQIINKAFNRLSHS